MEFDTIDTVYHIVLGDFPQYVWRIRVTQLGIVKKSDFARVSCLRHRTSRQKRQVGHICFWYVFNLAVMCVFFVEIRVVNAVCGHHAITFGVL